MPDREKVIKALEMCIEDIECSDCPYEEECFAANDEPYAVPMMRDALALLKEKETVEPIAKEDDTYECICGAIVGWDELDASGIVQTQFNYCPFCGRSVKWE